MKFMSIRDLRGKTASLRRDLKEGCEIVVTANGQPFAIMTPVGPGRVEEELLAIRRARAQAALTGMRSRAKAAGLDSMTIGEVDAVITASRRDRPAQQ